MYLSHTTYIYESLPVLMKTKCEEQNQNLEEGTFFVAQLYVTNSIVRFDSTKLIFLLRDYVDQTLYSDPIMHVVHSTDRLMHHWRW